jgi:hypothetical protein
MATPAHTQPSYDPRKLLDPKQHSRTPPSPSKMTPKPPPIPVQHHQSDNSSITTDVDGETTRHVRGSNSMLEGLYSAEKRQDLPQKRKRVEAIVIDDDDDEDQKQTKRVASHHKGTGIIGEYMKEGKNLAPPSNGLPVDLTKGLSIPLS